MVHRNVGVVEQGLRIDPAVAGAAAVAARDPDRDRGLQRQPVVFDRLRDGCEQAFGEAVDLFGQRRFERHHRGELVSSQPGQHAFGRQQRGDPVGGFLEQHIPCDMTVEVVDGLEVVEIEQHEGHFMAALMGYGEQLVGGGADAPPVEAAGQGIGQREHERLLFGTAALAHFAGQVAVAAPAEDDQRDVEDQRIGQHRVGRLGAAEPRLRDLRQHLSARADEHDDRRDCDPQSDDIVLRLADAGRAGRRRDEVGRVRRVRQADLPQVHGADLDRPALIYS